MKNFFKKFVLKPKELKTNVERESKAHKAKIICFSVAMGLIAGSYQGYFDNLVYRSGQLQAKAMAGELSFATYSDFKNPLKY